MKLITPQDAASSAARAGGNRRLTGPIRTGLVGTGYIAEFHARAIAAADRASLVAVCDANLSNAEAWAKSWGVAKAYASLQEMLAAQQLDCVHILAPPDLHHALARTALEAGVHVLLEKPMCVSVSEADDLIALAEARGLHLAVNHNMMFTDAYRRLREAVQSGAIGPINQISISYYSEMGQVRFGPFETWMLRAPCNIALETGPHVFSMLLDLGGTPGEFNAVADRAVIAPGGRRVFRRWRVHATAGRLAGDVTIDHGPGFDQRTIAVHGLAGTALADLNANTCLIDRATPLDPDFDRLGRSRALARQLRMQSWRTLGNYLLSKLKLGNRGNPFQASIVASVGSFYATLHDGGTLDQRIDGRFGRDVIAFCSGVVTAAGVERNESPQPPARKPPASPPTILVLGGAGFIGRELIAQLIAKGHCVRAMLRGSSALLDDLDQSGLEIVRGDLRRETDLRAAMAGIQYVYHLAVGQAKIWDDYQRNEVDSARLVGELCLELGIKRLIYTGTIDSYYAGARGVTITEQTPLDPNIARRNYYARAKAAAEGVLTEMQRTKQLPLVIFRPGIVIGRGGSPFHWGVGKFTGNVCQVWGDGDNPLPFVLVSDVAEALLRGLSVPGIEGRSYNLIDAPLLSARDYLQELQRRSALKLIVRHPPIWRLFLSDAVKWMVKVAVRHPDRIRVPSYFDWDSRTQRSTFDCARARAELGWTPASDRQRLIDDGIGGALQPWLEAVG